MNIDNPEIRKLVKMLVKKEITTKEYLLMLWRYEQRRT